ncbi:hypothetical protein EG68_01765 [Paragonimus skrjabini miyazakii]|uniref:Apple domain-containing protein n=1 Tax=Paragonimus skrjabini miyazakii TaxID=59628 RepID=A0A8S9Z1K4_9TREM|nr:hypothetical protein EG68_01765 [Paragonimus skrjabini miyazakii]
MENCMISATSVSIIFSVIFLESSYVAMSSCPIGLVAVGKAECVLKVQKSVTYCWAHRICYMEGLRRGSRMFLMGKNADILINEAPDPVLRFYGIHSLLQDMGSSTPSWMYSDPGCSNCMSDQGTGVWKQGEPNGRGRERVVMCNHEGCADVTQRNKTGSFVCEKSNHPMPNRWAPTKYRTNWPLRISSPFMADDQNEGCFVNLKLSTSLLCSLKCKITNVCRSFYHNSQTGYCYLALYVDSLLPKSLENMQGIWVRFVKPDY